MNKLTCQKITKTNLKSKWLKEKQEIVLIETK